LNGTFDHIYLQILNTIESIRKNDPRLFDKSQSWYDEPSSNEDDDEGGEAKGGVSKKKMTYKDVVREQILQTGTADSSSSDEEGRERSRQPLRGKAGTLAYDREQQEIRKKFLESVKGMDGASDDESDGSGDSMLRAKPKTDAELEEEQRLLKEKLDKVIDVSHAEKPDEAKFLYDYLLNKKWSFPKDKSRDSGGYDSGEDQGEDIIDEDEEELDNVDRFESKYNFRFEELADGRGPPTVVGHARNVEGSVRRVDDKRKLAREARKERKEKEKRQKEAELKRLKNLKRQEVSKDMIYTKRLPSKQNIMIIYSSRSASRKS
jgi:protein KRI1